jgi:hypothetical protein
MIFAITDQNTYAPIANCHSPYFCNTYSVHWASRQTPPFSMTAMNKIDSCKQKAKCDGNRERGSSNNVKNIHTVCLLASIEERAKHLKRAPRAPRVSERALFAVSGRYDEIASSAKATVEEIQQHASSLPPLTLNKESLSAFSPPRAPPNSRPTSSP